MESNQIIMETSKEIIATKSKTARSKPVLLSKIADLYKAQLNAFENSRFALMTIFITLQSCIGSIACMLILQNGANAVMLGACAATTMASNSVFIAQAEPRWCLVFFYLSLVTNISLILINM